jgi:integrase
VRVRALFLHRTHLGTIEDFAWQPHGRVPKQPAIVFHTHSLFRDEPGGYAKANRLKPSGIASKKTIRSVHLIPVLGDKPLDQISTEDVQGLKSALAHRSPKTVNNVLAVVSVLLRTAVEWDVISRVTCAIKQLHTSKTTASFYDFGEYARLLDVARSDPHAYLIAVLGGEAGLRCGEMMALEWTDVDMNTRQLCVARSEWKGHVTVPKGPPTVRAADQTSDGGAPPVAASARRTGPL